VILTRGCSLWLPCLQLQVSRRSCGLLFAALLRGHSLVWPFVGAADADVAVARDRWVVAIIAAVGRRMLAPRPQGRRVLTATMQRLGFNRYVLVPSRLG